MKGSENMDYMPFDYGRQMVLDHFQLQPSEVKGVRNAAVEVQKRYLYNQLYSVYDFTLPKEWPLNVFRMFLFRYGSLGVVYTKQFGWIFWPYGVTKVGLYYLPSEIEIWNGHLKQAARGVLGVNAEIIHCMDDYMGLDDLVTEYAQKIASMDKSINVNLMNCNVSLMAEARNAKDAQDIKNAYSEATTGKPMVVLNKELQDGQQLRTLIENPKGNFLALEMLQARRDVVNDFLTRIGIPTANYDKRAQMSDDEVRQRGGETKSICSIILENLQDGFERLNAISGLGLKVRFREVVTNGPSDTLGNAAVISDSSSGD